MFVCLFVFFVELFKIINGFDLFLCFRIACFFSLVACFLQQRKRRGPFVCFFWVHSFSLGILPPKGRKTDRQKHKIFLDNTRGLQSLRLKGSLSDDLKNVSWPKDLQSLEIEFSRYSLLGVALPENLQNLACSNFLEETLEDVMLPKTLLSLSLGYKFKQSLANVSLPTLQSLTFGCEFNKSLADVTLPETLQQLTFGDCFNQPLKGLPRNLRSLTFGKMFNQTLEGALPENLLALHLGGHFQHFGTLELPSKLETLVLSQYFNGSLKGIVFPSSLVTLKFGNNYERSLEGITWPRNLVLLKINDVFLHSLFFVLRLGSNMDLHLKKKSLFRFFCPGNLQSLSFGDNFNQNISGVSFPETLQTLTFGTLFDQSFLDFFIYLLVTLLGFLFGSFCYFSILFRVFDLFFVAMLSYLLALRNPLWGDWTIQGLEGLQLPSGLRTLSFGSFYNESLEKVQLPGNLETWLCCGLNGYWGYWVIYLKNKT